MRGGAREKRICILNLVKWRYYFRKKDDDNFLGYISTFSLRDLLNKKKKTLSFIMKISFKILKRFARQSDSYFLFL